jgi:hypothetical protein
MNLSAALARRLPWLQLPAVLLLTLLQRTPAVRVATAAAERVLASPVGQVLRAAVATAASLGAMHSLAGATQFVQNPTGVIRGNVGTTVTVAFTINGSPTPPNTFILETALPPGLNSIPAPQGNRIRSGSPVITGIPTQAGTFAVRVTGTDGVYSQTDTITFVIVGGNTAPSITGQPANVTANAGANASFSVVATGTPAPTFQWRKDGVPLTGATAATLSLNAVTAANAGSYTAVVTNAAGTATSNAATLTVNSVTAIPTITTQPASIVAAVGGTATFSIVATGNPSPTYQWLKNSLAIPGATAATLTLTNLTLADAANYVVNLTNTFGTVTSAAATLNVDATRVPPTIATQPPAALALVAGQSLTLNVGATGSALTYQWRRVAPGGTADIAGATSPSLTIKPVSAADAGIYFCVVANAVGSENSAGAIVAVAASSANPGRLVNLSVLTTLAPAGDTFSLGYVVSGATANVTKPLVIRAAGPSLGALGVPGTHPDPKLELFAGSSKTGENDEWGGSPAIANAMAAVGAFPYAATTSRDAAVTASITGRDNSVKISSGAASPNETGLVIGEVYDATPAANFNPATTPRLINLSVRKEVGTSLTMGFVIGGSTAKTMLVRAVGPGLAVFGVGGTIDDPKVELFDATGKTVATNDNWGGTAALTATFTDTGAFNLPATSRDAALLVTLAPGNYTAKVSVASGATGLALVEVYEAP